MSKLKKWNDELSKLDKSSAPCEKKLSPELSNQVKLVLDELEKVTIDYRSCNCRCVMAPIVDSDVANAGGEL